MDNRPIGFFDSGLGGLTCIDPLMKALPRERIIYFGDTARTPYGSKAPSTIRGFSNQIAEFLVQQDVKMIVIACNTVSSTSLDDLRERWPDLPILGIIEPAARRVVELAADGARPGIIGTKVTIRSKAHERLIHAADPGIPIHGMACPVLVPLIEEGIIEHDIMDLSIRYYLDHFLSYHRIDTLVLGCTHYPLIRANIEKLYPGLSIVNPSEEIVKSIQAELEVRGLLADRADHENTFYASDLSENFINMINRIFEQSEFRVAFKNFDLDACK